MSSDVPTFGDETSKEDLRALLHGESLSREDIPKALEQLEQLGLVEQGIIDGTKKWRLTEAGHRRVDDVRLEVLEELENTAATLERTDERLRSTTDYALAQGIPVEMVAETAGFGDRDEFMEWRASFMPPAITHLETKVATTRQLLEIVRTAEERGFNRQLLPEWAKRLNPEGLHALRPILDHSAERPDLGRHYRCNATMGLLPVGSQPESTMIDVDVDQFEALATLDVASQILEDVLAKDGDPLLGRLKCDFCSSRPVVWDYDAEDFSQELKAVNEALGKVIDTEAFNSEGAWVACETCKKLLDAERLDALTERMARLFVAREPALKKISRAQRRGINDVFHQMLEGFLRHRKGPGKPVSDSGPKGAKLLVAGMLLELTGEAPSAQEVLVTRAMQEMWKPDLGKNEEVWSAFIALLRTAEIFVLDHPSAMDVLEGDVPPFQELPPLPYKRCIVEFVQDGKPVPFTREFMAIDDDGGVREEPTPILCVGIVEHEVGRLWDVYFPMWRERGIAPIPFRVTPEDVVSVMRQEDGIAPVSQIVKDGVLNSTVNLVHLITARNVPKNEVKLPRPQRRGYAREYRWEEPKIYYVDLWSAGDERRGGGDPSREYHVRWMVRGHYRHDWHAKGWGTRDCSCPEGMHAKSIKSRWIESYVKGPPGAPFKGKPIYKQMTERDHEEEGEAA